MLVSTLLVLGIASAQVESLQSPEAFAEAVGLKEVSEFSRPGLQVWCEDRKQAAALEPVVETAWSTAEDLLGGPVLPEDTTIQVAILHEEDALRAFHGVIGEMSQAIGARGPDAAWMESVVASGSGLWSRPPLIAISGRTLRKAELQSRLVHDLGALLARYAASFAGARPPEFLNEGFAGLLVRRSVKKPAALVSHAGAALEETIHGYGVFAGLGAAMNDGSNHPRGWPRILENAVKRMERKEELEEEEMLSGLLLRSREGFSRTDYAYAWAAAAFLLDDREPCGEDAAADVERGRRAKRPEEPLEDSRRTRTQEVLARLRGPAFAASTAEHRAQKLRDLLLEAFGEDPEALQAAFMHWVRYDMPRK